MNGAFPLIEIEGPPFVRGAMYGRQAGDRIALGLAIYGLESRHSAAEPYLAELQRLDGELAEELAGIARGAEQPVTAIAALNARSELTAWDSAAAADPDGCTAAVAMPGRTKSGRLIHGQTWDWRPQCVETAIVLRVRAPGAPTLLTFCEAGQLARHGMNAAGLALTANGLQTTGDFRRAGAPSPFARRRMLMSGSLGAAVGVLLNTPRSASHNLLLSQMDAAGRAEAINFETTPDEAFWSFPEDGLLTHANHFKHPAVVGRVADVGLLRHPESLYRDRRVRACLETDGAAIDVDSFKAAFADEFGAPNAVCRPPTPRADGSISATVAALVMDAADGRMWAAPSPYAGARYAEYRVDG